jgi:hypothetical protein
MAGMYPDNQSIEIFGESVPWPGVDASGKFTNGSFSDPQVKPSFIPAETINLILDNLEALITELGGTPNNTSISQLATLFSAAKLMERIKSVDGEQSGLDAGKLAGQPGSYYAPIDNPTLTGTPRAPTAEPETNNTQIATTAFVQGVMDGIKSVIRGFISLGLTNIDNSSVPQIAAGSKVEVGGSLYGANGAITGTPTANAVNYIYAVPSEGTLSFSYASTQPTWNSAKGGWYNGNNRAVGKLFYTNGQYNGKVILDGYNAMRLLNADQTVPMTGGMQVVNVTYSLLNIVLMTTLPAGAYRYEMKAGTGGRGGNNKSNTGGAGAAGEQKAGTFMLYHPTLIHYALGGNGNNGEDTESVAGGGGGCTGGSAFIDLVTELVLCLGGSGGGGAGRDDDHPLYGGAGGAGGYGTAADGTSSYGGKGGSNGVGGNGGMTTKSGGGGSGYLRGGASYGEGKAGGGYGSSGGNGETGGIGGASEKGENVLPTDKYMWQIQYQGGGGAGGAIGGAAGGSGLKSTSSGYLNIYMMW